MTARDDALRADLRALADEWERLSRRFDPSMDTAVQEAVDRTFGRAATQLRNLLDAHEPATEPEAPRIEDVLAAHGPSGSVNSREGWIECLCGERLTCELDSSGYALDQDSEDAVRNAHVAQAIREARAV